MKQSSFKQDFTSALIRPSPNFDKRCDGAKIQFLILHYTDMETSEAAERLLESKDSKVSAHYVVREDGVIVQMVQENDRAWHAGESCFSGIKDINSHSIGIEIANGGAAYSLPEYKDVQIDALIVLCQSIIKRHNIKPRYVLGHSDIAPNRKVDPGEKFPWQKLYENGIGNYVEPMAISGNSLMEQGARGQPVAAYQSMLALYGYDIDINSEFDEKTTLVTKAFQRHFRPQKIDGVVDISTIDTLQRLLQNI